MEQTKKPDDEKCLVYSVPEAGRLLGLNRSKAYAAARSGEIPTLRFGKILRVPAVRLHRMIEE
jgi:excisionase family DNA binding protein